MPLSVQVPFPVFQDRDGQPLDAGYVWIGQPYLSPQTNPLQVYFDRDLTIPAAQPLRTLNGYISNAGTPAQVYVDAPNFSILVQDKKGTLIYTFNDASGINPDSQGIAYDPPFPNSTPTNVEVKLAQFVSVKDFGAVGNGVTNDYSAIQAAIDYLESIGGGKLFCENGKTYAMNPAPAIKNNVKVDMCGSRWNMTLGSGNVPGVRLGTNSGIENGSIYAISTGSPSSQYFWHAAISLGEANNMGYTPGNPGYYQFANNWYIKNITLHTTRPNCPALQGMGGIHNGILENIYIPDSSTCSGIHFDWGNVGTVSSSNIPQTRTDYDAGLCYTTHPNNITIRNLITGNLSFPFASPDIGTRAIRLSACYGIKAENIKTAGTTYAVYNHIGGDLGFEFAQSSVRFFACRGNSIKNVQGTNSRQFGAYIDTYADNVAGAVGGGYSPIFDTIMQGDITLEQFTTAGIGANTNEDGIRLEFVNGVYIKDANCFNHNYGLYIDQSSSNIKIEKGNYYYSQRDGIAIRNNANIRSIVIDGVQAQRNGIWSSWTTKCGINVDGGADITLQNCFSGSYSEDIQNRGIVVGTAGTNVSVLNCTVREVVAGGIAYVLAADGDYDTVSVFVNNIYKGSAGTAYTGQRIIPIQKVYDITSQLYTGVFTANRVFLSADTTPPNGTWRAGDRIFFTGGVSAGGYTGSLCITSGSPGTWKRFGIAEA